MPTQVYAVLGQSQPVQPVSALKAELMALMKALVAEEIPVLRNEMKSEIQSLEQRLGAQLALSCTAFENIEQRTNDLHVRLQTLQTHEEKGKTPRPPSYPIPAHYDDRGPPRVSRAYRHIGSPWGGCCGPRVKVVFSCSLMLFLVAACWLLNS